MGNSKMKKVFFSLLVITFSSLMGRAFLNFQNKTVNVLTEKQIDKRDLVIDIISTTGWNTTIYPIFKNGKADDSSFPKKAGVYNLKINYLDSLSYNEILFYRDNPNLENLSFNFYLENNLMFCKISSIQAIELNKLIVMNVHVTEADK